MHGGRHIETLGTCAFNIHYLFIVNGLIYDDDDDDNEDDNDDDNDNDNDDDDSKSEREIG